MTWLRRVIARVLRVHLRADCWCIPKEYRYR